MRRASRVDVDSVMESIQTRLKFQNQIEYLLKLRELPKPHRSLWATWIVQCEVDDGGFNQYFWNMEAEGFYDEAELGFTELGAIKHLRIFKSARTLIMPHLQVMHTWQNANDRFSKYKPLLNKEGIEDRFSKLEIRLDHVRPTLPEIRKIYINANAEAFS
jgi:hypothetical protein